MNRAKLSRAESSSDGTFGKFVCAGLSLFSLELPWKDDENNVSCIPTGLYVCRWTLSPRLKKNTYEVFGDKHRTGIRLHSANLAKQLLGCIALGKRIGFMDGVKAILISRPAISALESHFNRQPFELEVV